MEAAEKFVPKQNSYAKFDHTNPNYGILLVDGLY